MYLVDFGHLFQCDLNRKFADGCVVEQFPHVVCHMGWDEVTIQQSKQVLVWGHVTVQYTFERLGIRFNKAHEVAPAVGRGVVTAWCRGDCTVRSGTPVEESLCEPVELRQCLHGLPAVM